LTYEVSDPELEGIALWDRLFIEAWSFSLLSISWI